MRPFGFLAGCAASCALGCALSSAHEPRFALMLLPNIRIGNWSCSAMSTTGVPNVGVRLCGGYDNRATIVAPSSNVLLALRRSGGLDHIVVYE